MEHLEQNEIIISKDQFKIMADSYYMHMYIVFDMSLTSSKLEWNGYELNYNYTIATETSTIDFETIFDTESIINVVSNYLRTTGREAYDCSVIDNLDGTISLRLGVKRIKPKQKSKGGLL